MSESATGRKPFITRFVSKVTTDKPRTGKHLNNCFSRFSSNDKLYLFKTVSSYCTCYRLIGYSWTNFGRNREWKVYNLWRSGILCRNYSGRPRVQRKSVGRLTRRCDKKSPTVFNIAVEISQLAKFHLQNDRKRIFKTSKISSGDDLKSGGISAPLPQVSVRAAYQPLMQRCFLVLLLRTPPLREALSRSGRGSFSHAAPHNHLSAHRSAHLFRVIRLNPQAEWLKQVKSDYVRLPAPARLS